LSAKKTFPRLIDAGPRPLASSYRSALSRSRPQIFGGKTDNPIVCLPPLIRNTNRLKIGIDLGRSIPSSDKKGREN
jgi:hypothetical protein